ncbi:PfkB domain protein [Segniliparus rotundus DSM 44985]|uniref:Ribokinase n=1 Tax=Segniliparus rotundus (strain ATCC BAA-972 / CDC 1076 / CIP 108378 / DSM 44985 / JCM 13578) TaxID=640132 RepID=D6Z7G7_SEGRD|nr:ribokinase [Segniliparus rotundus]ADG97897.1 PfkB domain protein [Segniliparus rotundus DSM 44985]
MPFSSRVPAVPRVAVFGSVNQDLVLRVQRPPHPGETVMAKSVERLPGGKGANQAVAAARAGAKVQFIGSFGEDEVGSVLRGRLRRERVGLTGSMAVPGPNGIAVILVDDTGENMIIVPPGANDKLTLTEAAESVLTRVDIILCQLEVPFESVVDALRVSRAAGVLTIVNFSPVPAGPFPQDILELADVLIVNEGEGRDLGDRINVVPHVVTTLGARGARYRGPLGEVQVPSPKVNPVDTTGAGDVFAGVLSASWHLGPEKAVRRAAVAGALATLVSGAGNCAPTAAKIDEAAQKARQL